MPVRARGCDKEARHTTRLAPDSRPSPFLTELAHEAAALPGALQSAYPALLADYLGCVFPDGDGAAVVSAAAR